MLLTCTSVPSCILLHIHISCSSCYIFRVSDCRLQREGAAVSGQREGGKMTGGRGSRHRGREKEGRVVEGGNIWLSPVNNC